MNESTVPLSQVKQLIELASTETADKLMSVMAAKEEQAQRLSNKVEGIMVEQKESEESKEKLRKMLDELPEDAQYVWCRAYYSAREYAQGEADLKVRAEEYAARTAWDAVKRQYKQLDEKQWQKKGSVEFDSASGKWIVSHRDLLQPRAFSDQQDAEHFARLITAREMPSVKWDGDKQSYSVTHPSWDEPVLARSVEDAMNVMARKMVDEGWSEAEAREQAGKLAESVKKEAVMASIEVKGEAKQNVKGGPDRQLVTGIAPCTEGVKSGPKGDMPKPPGYVSTEKPALETLPKSDLGESMQQTHEKGAQKSDALINQLRTHRGLMHDVKAAGKIDPKAVDVVMKAGIEVEAETKQNTKGAHCGELVTGIPSDEGAKTGPKGSDPNVGGKVVTEKPVVAAVPAKVSSPHEMKQKHTEKDYASLARQTDQAVIQLQKKRGLCKE